MNSIAIGEMRHRITIQILSASKDSFQQEIKGWTNFETVWAKIEPLSGREFFEAQQMNAEITHRITMRYMKGLNPKMRIMYGERIFDIKTILNIEEKNIELQILCKELVQ